MNTQEDIAHETHSQIDSKANPEENRIIDDECLNEDIEEVS